MCDTSILRLTAQEREEERYRELYEQVEASMKSEYERDFGPTYRAAHPFKPDWKAIDKVVTKMMCSSWE